MASYHHPEINRLERERPWPRVWQMACREAELQATGDLVNYEILDDSISIVRAGPEPDDLVAMSRGLRGCMLNPVQEPSVSHFQSVMNSYRT